MANTVVTGSADVFTSGSITMGEIFAFLDTEPVGTVKESILTESQFQSMAGNGWVLADGRSLNVSSYPDLFAAIAGTYAGNGYYFGGAGANFNIPDMRNRYSRMSGTYTLGSCQTGATKKNGLSISGGVASLTGSSTILSADHRHCLSRLVFPFCGSWADPKTVRNSAPICSTTLQLLTNFYDSPTGYVSSKTGVAVNGCSGTTSSAFAALECTPSTVSSSATETRPTSIVLSWFMRIK